MDPDSVHNYYRYRNFRFMGPWYYDYPDGEDLLGKMTFCGEAAFVISANMGIVNAYCRYPYPTSQAGRLLKLIRAVGPGVGMGLAFAVTTFYATRYRQKDDSVNHALGGAAAGAIIGTINGFAPAFYLSIFLAGFAAAAKSLHDLKKTQRVAGRGLSAYIRRNVDFSGVPYKEGNWVKAPAPHN